jgi:hypothetical protein
MYKCWFLIVFVFLGASGSFQVRADSGDTILIGTPDVQVTAAEVMLYLEFIAMEKGVDIGELSSSRVSQAIIELYGLKTASVDAAAVSPYSPGLEAWISKYLFVMHQVSRYIDFSVDEAMAATEWTSEAQEFYAANIEDFMVPETVTVRTLLLRTSERSVDEALEIADSLPLDTVTEESFESLVYQYSEDEAGRATGGLMNSVSRGQTVLPFEEAAFSLEEPGELSPPVISEFGVHLIQLLSRAPARTKPFDEVAGDIIESLKPIRKAEYREAIKNEARDREPVGYEINEQAIDAFMTGLGHRKLDDRNFVPAD